ncbi:MAG TPA: hypothetical protein VK959_10240 [Methylophilaceae bacterium]|jgi:hypothetical protein|nr:hypothetical protein [Methylophilaceae bacterium]
MDYKDLTSLLVKIIGAVLLFWYISWLPTLIPDAIKAPSFWPAFLLAGLPSLGNLAIGLILFFFPATITNKLIDGNKLNTDKTFLPALQVLALRLVGVFYVFNSIIDLVTHFSTVILTPRIYLLRGITPPLSAWTPTLAAYVVATFVELGLALWLVLGAEGISNSIQKIRGRHDF